MATVNVTVGDIQLGTGTSYTLEDVVVPRRSVFDDDFQDEQTSILHLGRDLVASPEVDLHIGVSRTSSAEETFNLVRRLRSEWEKYRTSETAMTLNVANRRVVAFGRPRGFEIGDLHSGIHFRYLRVRATFQMSSPWFYGAERKVSAVSHKPNVKFGFVFPAEFPLVMQGSAADAAKGGTLQVKGEVPSPVRIRVYGPVKDPVVTIGKVRVPFTGVVPSPWIEVDARARTVKTYDGRPAHMLLGAGVRFSDLLLPPGDYPVLISVGAGNSDIGSVDVWTRDAYATI